MQPESTIDAQTLALRALAAALGDQRLAERFLSLSGLTAPELRQSAADPRLLTSFLCFLEAHEPDLLAIAAAVDTKPERLVEARRMLEA